MSKARGAGNDRRPAWWRHMVRALGRDRGGLCRPVDRARSRLQLALPVLLALAAVCSVMAGLANFRSAQAEARADAAHLHRVEAVVASPSAQTGAAVHDSPNRRRADASWVAPSGETVTGRIPVAAGTGPGSTVALWVDDAGAPAHAPRSESELRGSAAVIGIGTMSGLSLAVVAVLAEAGRRVERRAEALWEPEWEQVEPTWSGRAPGPPGNFTA